MKAFGTLILLLAAFGMWRCAASPPADPHATVNSTCPIQQGEPVDPEHVVTVGGHRIGLCCAMCEKSFHAMTEPEKEALLATALR